MFMCNKSMPLTSGLRWGRTSSVAVWETKQHWQLESAQWHRPGTACFVPPPRRRLYFAVAPLYSQLGSGAGGGGI